jgi:hypothetical protein
MVAPKNSIGFVPENAGRPRASVPQTTTAMPRNTIPTPIVTMMPRHTWPPIGPIVTRSISAPTTPVAKMAVAAASGNDMPIASSEIVSMAPIIALSP